MCIYVRELSPSEGNKLKRIIRRDENPEIQQTFKKLDWSVSIRHLIDDIVEKYNQID